MIVFFPCDCEGDDFGHEFEVTPEGSGFYGGLHEGDTLPCGRVVTKALAWLFADRAFETIRDSHDYE